MSNVAKEPVGRAKNKIVKISELGKQIQYPANPSLNDRVEIIQSFLEKDLIYWDIKRTVKEAIFSPDFNVDSLREDVTRLLEEAKLATGLKNAVYLYDKQAKAGLGVCRAPSRGAGAGAPVPPMPVLEEPIEAIAAARTSWDNRLRYELRSVAAKQKRKLIRPRDFNHKDDNDYLIRFVYTSEDLLETITNIQNSNVSTSMAGWGLIKMELNTPSLHALRNKYKELTPDVRQIGVDDTVLGCEWFATEQLETGEKLIQEAYIPVLREYAKTGVPPALRPMLWCKCLGVDLTQQELHYFECLLAQVQQWDLITDDLTRFDVQDCSDSDEFFVFEEVLDEVMLAFTRDPEVPKMCSIKTTTCVLRGAKQATNVAGKPPDDTVPPCTVIPYHRQVMFAAPLGYLFYRADEAYFLFRALYCRYFVRLSVISSQPDTIMYLCKMFENVMQLRAPDAFYHAVKVGTHPLSLAFPWMFSAFSGWLEVEQVLLLWDRILAYDSLELLALLAAAIFLFRAKSVMEATTPEDIQGIFREMSNLKVIPLLQQFLFAPSNI